MPQVVDEYALLGQQAFPATEITRLDCLEEAPVCRPKTEVEQDGQTRHADEQQCPVAIQRRRSRPEHRVLDDAGQHRQQDSVLLRQH